MVDAAHRRIHAVSVASTFLLFDHDYDPARVYRLQSRFRDGYARRHQSAEECDRLDRRAGMAARRQLIARRLHGSVCGEAGGK